MFFKRSMPEEQDSLIVKLREIQDQRRKTTEFPVRRLKPANDPEVRSAFKKLKLPQEVLRQNLDVKLPDEIDPSKKYEVRLRKKETKRQYGQRLLEQDCSWNAEPVEDEEFLTYNPGWNVPPFDARFPHMNNTPNCEQNYMDYHRCKRMMGDDYDDCAYFKHVYMKHCPSAWYTAWDEQVEEGTFPYKI